MPDKMKEPLTSWLVGTQDLEFSHQIATRLQQNSLVNIERVIESEGRPRIIVAQMPESVVKQLREEFGERIHIEKNSDLSL